MASKGPDPQATSPFLQWREEYEAVLQETDHKMLFKRMDIAEAALLSRRELLMGSSDSQKELWDIQQAFDKLCTMKRDVLNF
jgi:hypothetical protein